MSEFSIKVEGLKELNKSLKLFPERIQKRLITSALRKAATPMMKAAKSNAQKTREPSSGALAESIAIKARKSRRGGTHRIILGPMRGDKNALLQYLSFWGISLSGKSAKSGIRHGHLVEFGHSAPNGGSVAPRPFLRPAFDANKARFIDIYKATLERGIYVVVKKLRRDQARARQ